MSPPSVPLNRSRGHGHTAAVDLRESNTPRPQIVSVVARLQIRSSRRRSRSPRRPRVSLPASRRLPRHGGGWGASSYSRQESYQNRAAVASPANQPTRRPPLPGFGGRSEERRVG